MKMSTLVKTISAVVVVILIGTGFEALNAKGREIVPDSCVQSVEALVDCEFNF